MTSRVVRHAARSSSLRAVLPSLVFSRRYLFGFKSSPSGDSSAITQYAEHSAMGWKAAQIYGVVADVRSYSQFLPWCLKSVVDYEGPVENGTQKITATLQVGFALLKEEYGSDVLLTPHDTIAATLHGDSTVLTEMSTLWTFSPISTESTEVHFNVKFAFRSALHRAVAGAAMSTVVTMMSRSFECRCQCQHGAPSHARRKLSVDATKGTAVHVVGRAPSFGFKSPLERRRNQGISCLEPPPTAILPPKSTSDDIASRIRRSFVQASAEFEQPGAY